MTPQAHSHTALEIEDTLCEILDQLSTGNLPGDDPDAARLIGAVRSRYPRDEDVQRLCAWLENQSGALGELVDGLIDRIGRDAHGANGASRPA